MEKQRLYSASKTMSEGRNVWAISFRHPLRKDARGKYGLKVRRSLATPDAKRADRLVEQMNELLSNVQLHNILKRPEAERQFDQIVVSAFYDGVEPEGYNPELIREQAIPLPGRADKYSRVLLVGTTGAGKTSLLRHLIGSHPERDRFPSTSTAKTTIADIEIVTATGPFDCVVTFFSEAEVITAISECIVDACGAIWDGEPGPIVLERLLNHRDQKFRLRYIIGPPIETADSGNDEWTYEGDSTQAESNGNGFAEVISSADQRQMQAALESFLKRTKELANAAIESLAKELDLNVRSLKKADREAAQEFFEDILQSLPDFDELLNDIREKILDRFDGIADGSLTRRSGGWPESWRLTEPDREKFLSKIRWFSSNNAMEFGRLLTPIVQGMRIRGPFFPSFTDERSNLVLIDGQGLGHTPDSAASVSTHITRKYDEVDVVLLVDNAEQPMQAAPLSVLRSVAASGHHQKLAIAFTHFDQVKGPNLPSFEAKRSHVLASLASGLVNLKDVLGKPIVKPIEQDLPKRCFILGWLDKPLTPKSKGPVEHLKRLIAFFEQAIKPQAPPQAVPVYDAAGLGFAVQSAARNFQTLWDARLGFGFLDGVKKQHFSRIKALNKRIALKLNEEYDTLKPVAELIARLSESIAIFLNKPLRWDVDPADDTEAEATIAAIRRRVFASLDELARKRLLGVPLSDWLKAYEHQGVGSATERAKDIQTIYRYAAPVPGEVMTDASSEFLRWVRVGVQEAIESCGGEIDSSAL